jgi:dedicated sortase system histidine kinase
MMNATTSRAAPVQDAAAHSGAAHDGGRGEPRWRFSLRTKLALLSLLLLVLPWVGYRYVHEMENFLLAGQTQALEATSRAVATALHDRPQLMGVRPLGGRSPLETQFALMPGEELLEPLPIAPHEAPAVAEVEAILKGLDRTTSRIWVVNRELRVLALAGSLKAAEPRDGPELAWWRRLWRRIVAGIVPPPGQNLDDALDRQRLASGREVHNALMGVAGSRVSKARPGQAVIVSAAYPIWNGDKVLGAVVVEETTNSILSLRNQALERLLALTLAGFAVAAVVLVGFASRLSSRIRRLRDEAESAIDAHGRITGLTAASTAGDEVGDLSRSFSALLERLARHHTYLESMASRLSHELRTPIAVVRSSLENLHAEPLPEGARTYMERAEAGLRRLSRILSRMSEASRLEQALAATESERFDLRAVVAECVNGYHVAYPQRRFVAQLPDYPVWVRGAPDLAAQMLDKLVENAADFALPETAIDIELRFRSTTAALAVSNRGPILPAELEGRLFETMASARKRDGDEEPHLGLGLYVARMIAGFHGGTLRAENLPGGDGVCVTAVLRLA